MRITMYDWNGSLLEDVKEDEKKFSISLKHEPGAASLPGFITFTVNGDDESIQDFLDYYELELDGEVEAR